MGDDDGRPPLHELAKRILDQRLGLRIDVGGRFVEDQHGRLERKRPCKGEQLPLPRGERRAALDHLMRITARQAGNEPGRIDCFRRRDDFRIRDLRFVQADVVGYIARKQEHILQHLPDVPPEVLQADLADVDIVDQDRSLLHIIVAADEVLDGRFPGARSTHKGDAFPGFHGEGNILQHPFFFPVSEPDVPELDLSTERIHADRVRLVHDLRLRIQQPEDALRAGVCGLHRVELLRKLLNGLKQVADVALEDDERANRNDAIERHVAAHGNEDRKRGNPHHIGDGAVKREGEELLHVDLAQLLRAVLEILADVVFRRKHLHDLHAGNMLRHKAVKLGYFCAHRPVNLPRRVAEYEGCHRDEG